MVDDNEADIAIKVTGILLGTLFGVALGFAFISSA
jgi:hypothetical protein